MLQKIDVATSNKLKMAEYLNDLDPSEFDMTCCGMCYVGHVGRVFGIPTSGAWRKARDQAADLFGLTDEQAAALFEPPIIIHEEVQAVHPKGAARVLRHLAATGEVDWGFAEGWGG
jgi:hypothetical protein